MDALSKEYVIDFFSKRLMLFGNTPAAVGWSAEGQRMRYECITNLLALKDGDNILDFGCGKGDFYGFLREKGIKVDYTGADINPELIKTASVNYPDARFLVLDIDSEKIPRFYDFIISCGVFNLNVEGVEKTAEKSLRKLFQHTNKTLLFNCLNACLQDRDIYLHYFEPAPLLSFASSITQTVKLYSDLIEGDIFLLLNREQKD